MAIKLKFGISEHGCAYARAVEPEHELIAWYLGGDVQADPRECKDLLRIVDEIEKGIRYARKKDLIPVIRPNGTSDQRWERIPVQGYPNLMELFADYQFYDYTKLENRRNIPSNYDLTFSRSETNWQVCEEMLANGTRVAVCGTADPFSGAPPSWGYPIVDGDQHDLTFLQPAPSIIWLKAKGRKAKEDDSGFTVHHIPRH